MLQSFRKALFVRNPLDRLWSAYNSKFVNLNPRFLQQYGRTILRRFRQFPSAPALECGSDVTFLEFISFVTTDERRNNVHWMLYDRLCAPCELSYDFIGKLETFEADMTYLLSRANVLTANVDVSAVVGSSLSEMIDAARRTPILKSPTIRDMSQNSTSVVLARCLRWDTFALSRLRFWRNVGFIGDNDNDNKAAPGNCRKQFLDEMVDWRGYDTCLWNATVLGDVDMSLSKIKQRKILAKRRAYANIANTVMRKLYGIYDMDFKLFSYAETT